MKTNYKTRLLSLLLIFGFSRFSNAQNENLRFEHLGIEEGLSNNTVIVIRQDSKGYMWFGTMDGLNKYDGYSFTKYRLNPFDSNSLSQNSIYTIREDKYGSIWVGTYEGLCRFDRSTENFKRFSFPSWSDPNAPAVTVDSDGMMWLGNFYGELLRFDRQTGFFPEKIDFGGGIYCIYPDRVGTLWVGCTTGLHRLDPTAKKAGKLSRASFKDYQHDSGNSNSLSSNFVTTIFEDGRGIIWIATDNGLNSFDRKTSLFKRYQHDAKNNNSISSNSMTMSYGNAIKEDEEGNLWIGTDSGLNKLSPNRDIFTSYFYNTRDPHSLSSNTVISLHIDQAGILYAGSWGGKLNKTNLNPKPFGLRRKDPNNLNSLSNNEVTSLLEDSSGIIWIGTNGGGLNRWDRKTNQFTHFRHETSKPNSLRNDVIRGILEDRHRHLWICNGDVLSQFNKQTATFTHYYPDKGNDKNEYQRIVLSITKDRQGLLWIGTGDGLKSFDEKTGGFEHYNFNRADKNGLSDGTVRTIFADSKDYIWIGLGSIATDKLDKRTGRFYHYKHDPRDSTSISSNIVNSFFEDSEGNLWLGTLSGGLCYFDYKKEKFTTFTDKLGLASNNVYSILPDDKNHLWLGTDNGISRFDPATKTFINYDYTDGLQSNIFAAGGETNTIKGAHSRGRDGTLYFGGNNGFNFFDPAQIKPNNHIAPIVVTQFKLFDSLVKGANELKEIVLDYDQNYFSFEFSSLSYYNPAKNQYAYKLEGVDKAWVNSGSRRYVSYTNIDPGEYIFKVIGTNNDGVWNETGTNISMIITPPWWRTWWAYSFYGACFIASIFILYRYQRNRVIIKERERARVKELEQAREIEKAYHELKRTQAQLIQSEKMASLGELTAGIAHEIQNPLNFVNNFSEVNTELIQELRSERARGKSERDEELEEELLNDISQNLEKINQYGKRADAIVKGMLQHSQASAGKSEPTDINALANEYLRLAYHAYLSGSQALRAKDKSFNVTMQTDFDTTIGTINVIPQDIGRVLLNLYNNAFYSVHTKASSCSQPGYNPEVSVSTKRKENNIEITVTDNGNGIPEKIRDKIFQPFFTTKPTGQGTGLGLSLSYDIITKEHNGTIKVETKEGDGAKFVIELPIN